MRKANHTNIYLNKLIEELRDKARQENIKIWARMADDLAKPTRKRRVVNLTRIVKNAKAGETIVVPGKVLAGGEIEQAIEIAAFTFSEQAKEKIEKAKGKCFSIQELMKTKPKKMRIIG